MPGLNTAPDDPFAEKILAICRQHAGSDVAMRGELYGTDASWMSAKAPALVLGPGCIDSAHAIDEHIAARDDVTATAVYRAIIMQTD